jgi:predicted RNA-binding Zn ribbon-like protein
MDDVSVLTLVGGHPALDLVNTVDREAMRPDDAFRTPADVVRWAMRVGLLDADEAAAATSLSLRALRALREAVYVVVLATVGELEWTSARVRSAMQVLDRASAGAARRTVLTPPGTGDGGLRQVVGVPGGQLLLDRIAVAAVDLLTSDRTHRVRRCPIEEGGCGWVFLDATKNSSRTWCRMADCGTKVKSQRLTQRRREHRRAGRADK